MKIKTAVDCVCGVCQGQGEGWVCSCFCHAHNRQARKEATFFNVLGNIASTMERTKALSNEELLQEFCKQVGADERIDSYKCSLMDEFLFRFSESESRVAQLETAIKRHRDQRVDDRCWMDDLELYKLVGGTADNSLPAKEKFLANCARFYEARCKDANWISYQELEQLVARLKTACDLVLMFHSGSPWTYEKQQDWANGLTDLLGTASSRKTRDGSYLVVPTNEATTRNLCDAVRAAMIEPPPLP